MNLYGLLDAIINKVNRAVKVEKQELDSSLQKQARENINVPSKNEVCNPNLLDNWYFGNPVNQQNITSWSTGYGVDKWRVSTGATAQVLSDSLLFTGGAQYHNLEQSINNFTDLLGKTVTLSVLFKETVPDITFTTGFLFESSFYQEFISGDLYSVTYTIPLDATLMVVFIQDTVGNKSCNISAIKLELGDTQTLAHQDSNGNWVLNEIPKYSEELLKCRQYDPYTGEYIGLRKFGQPRNLLDNSDFRNPINQRNFSSGNSVAAGQYFIDRWKAYNDINSVTLNTDGFSVSRGGEGIGQHIEGLEYLVGKKVTIAIKYSDGYLSVASGTLINNNSWTEIAQANGANGSYIKLVNYVQDLWYFLIFPDVTKVVQWVVLYEGEYTADTLPEYQPKGYGAELAECQRYFRRLKNNSDSSNYMLGVGVSTSTTTLFISTEFSTPMRAYPAIEVSNVSDVVIHDGDTVKAVTSVNSAGGLAAGSTDFVQRSMQLVSTELTNKTAYRVSLKAGAHIDFNAEL